MHPGVSWCVLIWVWWNQWGVIKQQTSCALQCVSKARDQINSVIALTNFGPSQHQQTTRLHYDLDNLTSRRRRRIASWDLNTDKNQLLLRVRQDRAAYLGRLSSPWWCYVIPTCVRARWWENRHDVFITTASPRHWPSPQLSRGPILKQTSEASARSEMSRSARTQTQKYSDSMWVSWYLCVWDFTQAGRCFWNFWEKVNHQIWNHFKRCSCT